MRGQILIVAGKPVGASRSVKLIGGKLFTIYIEFQT
jgi:hypothetical protein